MTLLAGLWDLHIGVIGRAVVRSAAVLNNHLVEEINDAEFAHFFNLHG